jgi:hypothetical protein
VVLDLEENDMEAHRRLKKKLEEAGPPAVGSA